MAFGDSGCKLMVLRLRFFSWMAKRISLSTNKALLTVLPALHSLPWAYDSQPSDYHLNISFSEALADIVLGASGPPAFHAWGGQAVVADRRPVGQVGCCPVTTCHRTTTQVDASLFGFVTPSLKKLQSSRQSVQHASGALCRKCKCLRIEQNLDFKIINP